MNYQQKKAIGFQQNGKAQDIDRSLAIFYHPLFQEVTAQWTLALFQNGKKQNSRSQELLHPHEFQMTFLEFIEFNLKVQKCLLPRFDLSNAFVSALNDWVKEITECFNYSDLYASNENEDVQTLLKEIQDNKESEMTLPVKDYLKFIEMFKEHEAFKIVKFRITNEVFCKFLFDLCTTWCEFLDIELFVFFLYCVFLQISNGESGISDSTLAPTLSIQKLSPSFFSQFDSLKEAYQLSHKKNLRYYRAWCEWNYLRLNEMGESILSKIFLVFDEEENDRIFDLVSIFEKAIDTVNTEISSQANKQGQTSERKSEIQANIGQIIKADNGKVLSDNSKLSLSDDVKVQGQKIFTQESQHQTGQQFHLEQSQKQKYQDIKMTSSHSSSFHLPSEHDELMFQNQQNLSDVLRIKNQYQQLSQPPLQLKQSENNRMQVLQLALQRQQRQQMQDLQQFDVDFDDQGNIVLKKVVKIPIYGKRIEPQSIQPHSTQGSLVNYRNRQGSLSKKITPQYAPQQEDSLYSRQWNNINPLKKPPKQPPNQQSSDIYSFQIDKTQIPQQKQQLNNQKPYLALIGSNSLLENESPPKKIQLNQEIGNGISNNQQTGSLQLQIFPNNLESSENKQEANTPVKQFIEVKRKGEEKVITHNEQKIKLVKRRSHSQFTQDKSSAANQNSVLVPQFLQNMNPNILEKEQLPQQLNIFDQRLQNISNVDLLNEFGNSVHQTKRITQFDIPKKILGGNTTLDTDKLRQKVNHSFDQGNGKVTRINQILQPNYHIRVLPNHVNKSKNNSSQDAQALKATIQQHFQRDYQFEMFQDKNLAKIKEKSMVSQEGTDNLVNPNSDKTYVTAVQKYKGIWKKYLSEDDMYKLNNWDSLYKIIILLKKKFVQDHHQNYLDYLNLDLGLRPHVPEEIDDDKSTQADEEGHTEVKQTYVPDKEQFKKTIERLLKRDARRKKRRRQKRKLLQGMKDVAPNNAEMREKNKQNTVIKFKSLSNKQLFNQVFLQQQQKPMN